MKCEFPDTKEFYYQDGDRSIAFLMSSYRKFVILDIDLLRKCADIWSRELGHPSEFGWQTHDRIPKIEFVLRALDVKLKFYRSVKTEDEKDLIKDILKKYNIKVIIDETVRTT